MCYAVTERKHSEWVMNEKWALDLLHNISVKGLSLVAVKQRHDTTVQYNIMNIITENIKCWISLNYIV